MAVAVGVVGGSSIASGAENETPGQAPSRAPQANSATAAASASSLAPFYSATGRVVLSTDANGTNDASGEVEVAKPSATAKVRDAFLMASPLQLSAQLETGDIVFEGTTLDMATATRATSDAGFSNVLLNVTSLVKPTLDAAPVGRSSFTITEPLRTGDVDGEILAVVFNDPTAPVSTITLMYGAQAPAGDSFAIGLSEPVNPSAPNVDLQFSLGITYSYQFDAQYSTVDVNGERLSSSSGGSDDGQPANGALISVGGLDDDPANPSEPNGDVDFCGATPRCDDELYTLDPFLDNGDTSILVETTNPSNNDNIMFAALNLKGVSAVVGAGVLLTPAESEGEVNTTHTLTALVQDDDGHAISGEQVTFTIGSGPRAGHTGTATTGATGQATFSYSSPTVGTDTIVASIGSGDAQTVSNEATRTWTPEGDIPQCVEDGLNSLPLSGLLSQLLHNLEPSVEPLTRILLANLIHTLNCDLVVPVEDIVDAIIYSLLGGPTEPPVGPNPDGVADFNGDGTTDLGVFRPANRNWYLQGQPTVSFGQPGDIPVPGDYNGDGTADLTVYRPSTSTFYFEGTTGGIQLGQAGDIPAPGDFDGDGDADLAVFRPSTGRWFVLAQPTSLAFGISGDIPVPRDYDGDGADNIAIYRPSNGRWYVLLPDGTTTTTQFGISGDIPVPGDYDDDGDADIAVLRRSTYRWYVNGGATTAFGKAGDIPVPGDYDGDGDTDIAIFRPSNGSWYVNGAATTAFGNATDIPLPLPYAIRRVL